jgi:hypothetical protein
MTSWTERTVVLPPDPPARHPGVKGTGGWGLNMHFFRVPYLLSGPWYVTWLTSFVGLALMLAWGMWFGIIYRRWNLAGLLSFIAVQALAVTAVLLIIGGANAWHGVGHFFTTLTIEGLTGLLAVLTVVQMAGEVDDLLASHRMLTGPAGQADRYAERPVVHVRRAEAQAHLLLRAGADDPVPPGWEAHPGRPGRTRPGLPARAGRRGAA